MNVLNSAPKPNDVPLEPGPTDSVTRIEFNPVVDYLAVGSWDNQVGHDYGPYLNRREARQRLMLEPLVLTCRYNLLGASVRGQRYNGTDHAKSSRPA
jgi:hypothetical protein